MRLIDADALAKEWNGSFYEGTVGSLLNTASTIEPERKTGKWIVVDDGCISGKCSVCGWAAHMYEDDVVGMDYCPNCGSRLEGEGC